VSRRARPVVLLGHSGIRAHALGALWEKAFLATVLAWFALAAAWVAGLGAG
jgi:hypothetical protein